MLSAELIKISLIVLMQGGLLFVGDIRSKQRIYFDDPDIEIPERKNIRGRLPKKRLADIEAVKVARLCKILRQESMATNKSDETLIKKSPQLGHE